MVAGRTRCGDRDSHLIPGVPELVLPARAARRGSTPGITLFQITNFFCYGDTRPGLQRHDPYQSGAYRSAKTPGSPPVCRKTVVASGSNSPSLTPAASAAMALPV